MPAAALLLTAVHCSDESFPSSTSLADVLQLSWTSSVSVLVRSSCYRGAPEDYGTHLPTQYRIRPRYQRLSQPILSATLSRQSNNNNGHCSAATGMVLTQGLVWCLSSGSDIGLATKQLIKFCFVVIRLFHSFRIIFQNFFCHRKATLWHFVLYLSKLWTDFDAIFWRRLQKTDQILVMI